MSRSAINLSALLVGFMLAFFAGIASAEPATTEDIDQLSILFMITSCAIMVVLGFIAGQQR
jgi:hypothetical protein